MATYNKFNVFPQDLVTKGHDFSADAFKVMLTNTAPVATNAVKADITEIAAGGGYTAGGFATTITLGNSAGTETVKASNISFTASGSVGPFRYAVVYNSTSGKLVGWYDYASSITLTANDQFAINFDQTNGLLQIA